MAKRFVTITLAAKCRILFGAAALLILSAALVVPWLFMETVAEEKALLAGEEVTRLYLNEWVEKHSKTDEQGRPVPITTVSRFFVGTDPNSPRRGPMFMPVREGKLVSPAGDRSAARAVKTFGREPRKRVVQTGDMDEQRRRVYRTFLAVRMKRECMAPACHSELATASRPAKPRTLMGIVAADLPAEPAGSGLLISRLVIIGAGVLAFFLAVLTFHFITRKLILSPIRRLKAVADKVAEGDLTVRSGINTGDEYEQLGDSFDEMLEAITETQDQLRTANRALDLKLNELAESNVALFESNRLKSEFLANVSHELRTPLNSVIGFAELLNEMDDERVRRFAGNILTPARMLLRIINDLLDLAKIEAGKTQLTVTRVSLADICETLVSLVTPMAQKKDLTLSLALGEDLPIIRTDAGKVQQILYNLLSNAVKFTPPGGDVKVTAGYKSTDQTVSVAVADTGPGISEADQGHIFEKFHRLDAAFTREHSGTGLGLAIARDLTGLLGGSIVLVSKPGQGTTFTVTLPLEIPVGRQEPSPRNMQ